MVVLLDDDDKEMQDATATTPSEGKDYT